jgi:dihydroflavonol-4-reductase
MRYFCAMILVTGGTGLVGSHLLHLLLKIGEKVKATYRTAASLKKAEKVFSSYKAEDLYKQVNWVQADVADYFSLEDIFEGITHVYHCAAVVSFDRRKADSMYEVNVEGTKNMVNLSLINGIQKFCHVSSVASLGKYADDRCTDEEAIWAHSDETSYYSITKYYAENEVWRAAEEGLNTVIVNPATILGFGNWEESSTAIIKKVNDGLNYYTTGKNAFVGVSDVVRAMHVLMNSEVSDQRYVLVSENWSFKKLLSEIALGLGKNPPKKEAPRWLANLLRRLDEARYFIFGSKTVLTKQSVDTAFRKKCFSAAKIRKELQFEFEPMENVIKKVTAEFV